ncbi:MAG TPA: DUF3891 family protein [Candidatus Binatia bacterium]|jgi:hypothetical protein
MVVRELEDGSSFVSTQEDHAELSAQFAAHWGNKDFAKLRPYDSMVFATTWHDSGYREWEGNPPMNVAKGRPYAHRETIPDFETLELAAYARNVEWVSGHDRYAGLLISMHRTGLWANRYDTFTSPKGRLRERSPEVQAAKKEMERRQEEEKKKLAGSDAKFASDLWFNFRMLQVYDLLSLYFCCDGYAADDHFKEDKLAPIPLSYDGKEEVDLRMTPNGDGAVKIEPYPFDISPLKVSVRARLMPAGGFASARECSEAYHKAPRRLLTFEIQS